MSDDEARTLAALLHRLPPPARLEWAKELVEFGVRVHPELATKRLVREGPSWMGNHAPQRIAPIDVGEDELMGHLQTIAPGTASKVKQGREDTEAWEKARATLGALLPPELKRRIDEKARSEGRG